MKRKLLCLGIACLVLAGCSKTNELYGRSQYNSSVFDENYYTSWDGVDKINSKEVSGQYSQLKVQRSGEIVDLKYGENDYNPDKLPYVFKTDKNKEFGYNNCLSKSTKNKEFKYGITSKLFDGRVRCEGLYQLSRVQLNKTGFAMKFSKYLLNAKYLALSLRGGSDFEKPLEKDLSFNLVWSFYHQTEDGYCKVSFKLNDVSIPVDSNSETAFVSFMPSMFEDFSYEIATSEAMSFEWSCNNLPENTSDDFNEKEKHHLSLMLYEMFIGESEWR